MKNIFLLLSALFLFPSLASAHSSSSSSDRDVNVNVYVDGKDTKRSHSRHHHTNTRNNYYQYSYNTPFVYNAQYGRSTVPHYASVHYAPKTTYVRAGVTSGVRYNTDPYYISNGSKHTQVRYVPTYQNRSYISTYGPKVYTPGKHRHTGGATCGH